MASPLRILDSLQSQSRTTRELIIFVAALALGLFVIPPLIWLAGTLTLGPYENGGAGALFTDFFKGLASITPSFWVVALGPYVLILAARGVFSLAFPRKAAAEADGATRAEAQRGQQTQRRQAVRGADTQTREQPARRQPPQRRADPLFDDPEPETVEDSAAPEELPEPAPQQVAPPVRAVPPPQPPRAPPRQAPQMREPPAPQPREAALPQMRATPPARDLPPQMRQPPAQPREAPASMWPANPAQPREAAPQPRPAPPQAREAPPQRREPPPRAAPAPARAPAEPSPGPNDVKSTNKPGKKRIPPTIGDL